MNIGIVALLASLFSGAKSVLADNAAVASAVLVDAIVLGVVGSSAGKFEALAVFGAIVVSLACFPRVTFGLQPAPIDPSGK